MKKKELNAFKIVHREAIATVGHDILSECDHLFDSDRSTYPSSEIPIVP